MHRLTRACAIGLFVFWGRLPAQETSSDQGRLIQELMARIDHLEKRVAELENQPKAVAQGVAPRAVVPVAPPTSAPAPPPQPTMEQMPGMENPQPNIPVETPVPVYPSLRFAGFSDFDFEAADRGFTGPDHHATNSGFTEGQFTLHMTSVLSQKVAFFGEMTLSARNDAGTAPAGSPAGSHLEPGFNAELERSIISYNYNDHLRLSFGRYHTPINYWNIAFHHGQWLQTTVSRPEMVQVGGGFIPVHFVGGLLEGSLPSGPLNLNYSIGVGNGRGEVISRGGDFADINNNRAWLVSIFAKPDHPYRLQVGGAAYRDEITLLGDHNFREWIQSGHIVWAKENPELIAEFANISHQEVGSSVQSNSQAWYVQTAYRLPGAGRLWKPYYRFEHIHVPASDTLFKDAAVKSLAGSVAGIRFDISSFAAFKLEYRYQRRQRDEPRLRGVFAQTSFTF